MDRVQGRDQDVLPLGGVVIRESGCRDGLADAAFPAREDVPHLRSLLDEFGKRGHMDPLQSAGPNRRSWDTRSIMSRPRGSLGYIGSIATTLPANFDLISSRYFRCMRARLRRNSTASPPFASASSAG